MNSVLKISRLSDFQKIVIRVAYMINELLSEGATEAQAQELSAQFLEEFGVDNVEYIVKCAMYAQTLIAYEGTDIDTDVWLNVFFKYILFQPEIHLFAIPTTAA